MTVWVPRTELAAQSVAPAPALTGKAEGRRASPYRVLQRIHEAVGAGVGQGLV